MRCVVAVVAEATAASCVCGAARCGSVVYYWKLLKFLTRDERAFGYWKEISQFIRT